jgi:hypothetical protein
MVVGTTIQSPVDGSHWGYLSWLVPSTVRNANRLPPSDVTKHLNVKLRWESPDDLRRQSLLPRGYNVYRVTRAFAESRGWNGCPVPAALASVNWDAEVAAAFPQGAKVNRLPILPHRYYNTAEIVDFNLDDGDGIKGDVNFYTQDDNQTSDQRLRVTWTHLPADQGPVAYFVYRWRSLPEFRAAELADPLRLYFNPAVVRSGPQPGELCTAEFWLDDEKNQ